MAGSGGVAASARITISLCGRTGRQAWKEIGRGATCVITRTYTVTVSGVDVLMLISTYSATTGQLAAWNALWNQLLGAGAGPQISSEGGGDDGNKGRAQ